MNRLLIGSGSDGVLYQLRLNNWVPARPALSRWVSSSRLSCLLTTTERDGTRPSGTEWDFVDPPRNAQVIGLSPTSGSIKEVQNCRAVG
jgi:hypothetical protein